jgi:hypothetical protein
MTDLRQYGFPEYWYYTDTDSTLEHTLSAARAIRMGFS